MDLLMQRKNVDLLNSTYSLRFTLEHLKCNDLKKTHEQITYLLAQVCTWHWHAFIFQPTLNILQDGYQTFLLHKLPHLDLIHILLNHGFPVDGKNDDGNTALHLASESYEIFRCVLKELVEMKRNQNYWLHIKQMWMKRTQLDKLHFTLHVLLKLWRFLLILELILMQVIM